MDSAMSGTAKPTHSVLYGWVLLFASALLLFGFAFWFARGTGVFHFAVGFLISVLALLILMVVFECIWLAGAAALRSFGSARP